MPRHPRDDPDAPHLDRDTIVAAALEVIDRDGYDQFSLRRVAKHLDVGNMSLYWHIGDRETLLTLVLDHVIAAVELPEAGDDPFAALDAFAASFTAAFTAHPHTIPIFTLSPITQIGPATLAVFDHAIGLLLAAGIPDCDVPEATIAIFEYLAGHLVGHLTDTRHPDTNPLADLDAFLADLPPDALPHFRTVEDAFRSSADASPAAGLELLIDGLRSRAPRR